MFYCVKSHQKFKILDTFNIPGYDPDLMNYYVMLLRFTLRPSIVYCIQKIGIFRRSAVLINRLNHNIFLCFYVFGPSLGLYLEDVGMCWDENMHFEHLSRLRQRKSKSGVKVWSSERFKIRET